MAIKQKIDSNSTGLRYAEEDSVGVLPTTPDWIPLEPNSYSDFGGEITTVARNPINASRQRKKGVVTDLDASGGFNSDLTATNLQDIMQGFFFADARRKNEFGGDGEVTGVVASNNAYAGTGIETGFTVGDMVFASGFTNPENNGLKTVFSVTGPDEIEVNESLVNEGAPPNGAKLVVVGFEFTTDDLEVDASGSLPALNTTAKDFAELGLIPGEWIYIGGDAANSSFPDAENNGWARVKSINTNEIVLDKTSATMVTYNTAGGESIRVFVGRVLKNESDTSLIKRRTYNLERSLDYPETTQPNDVQGEYLVGAVANEFTLNMNQADKVTADLSFIAQDNEQRDYTTGLKTGNRPSLEESDAFNTTSHFSRLRMSILDPVNSYPDPLFAYLTEFTVSINNNVSPNKAIKVLGAFDMTAGTFAVSGDLTAYFSTVDAVKAVRDNEDITLDFAIAQGNKGILVDVPFITLGDGRLNVEQDEPITLPLSTEAAADKVFDHTLLMIHFDYLPDAAEA